jgi:hypothetical protein
MTKTIRYDVSEHAHRFAIWTAARAATRGMAGGTTKNIEKAIGRANLRSFLDASEGQKGISDFESYLKKHDDFCKEIISYFNEIKLECTYGRAAKIVAVYFKTRLLNLENHPLINVIFPPIDSVLLKNLANKSRDPELKFLADKKWTQFDEGGYQEIMEDIEKWSVRNNLKYWELEKYWWP